MFDSIEKSAKLFKVPDLEEEMGEIYRVAQIFSTQNREEFVGRFLEKARNSKLVPLDASMWSILENSDSYDIALNGWAKVDSNTKEENPDSPRDWKSLRDLMIKKVSMDAPIVLKLGDKFHLVTGNTRLMVARALGFTPDILLVDMS